MVMILAAVLPSVALTHLYALTVITQDSCHPNSGSYFLTLLRKSSALLSSLKELRPQAALL